MKNLIWFLTNYDEILKKEIRKIPGYPNYYADRSGNLYDKDYKYIKPYHYEGHYDQILAYDEKGNHRMLAVHQAVAMTFIPEWYPGCIVHHQDENKYNNEVENLEITDRSTHAAMHNPVKYFDKIRICEICGKKFVWSPERQQRYYSDLKRHRKRIITCSRQCSSYAGRMIQLKRSIKYKSNNSACNMDGCTS